MDNLRDFRRGHGRLGCDAGRGASRRAGGEDVEVVVAGEPEGLFGETCGDFALDDGEGDAESFGWRLGDEEMNVLGHDYVAIDREVVLKAGSFEEGEEG